MNYLEQDAAVGLRLGYFFNCQPVNLKHNWKMTLPGSFGSAMTAYHHPPLMCGFKNTFFLFPFTLAVCGMMWTGIYTDILSTLYKIVSWSNEFSVHCGPWRRQSWNFSKVWSFQGLKDFVFYVTYSGILSILSILSDYFVPWKELKR